MPGWGVEGGCRRGRGHAGTQRYRTGVLPVGVTQLSQLLRTGLGSPLLGGGWSSLEARDCGLCPDWLILSLCHILCRHRTCTDLSPVGCLLESGDAESPSCPSGEFEGGS